MRGSDLLCLSVLLITLGACEDRGERRAASGASASTSASANATAAATPTPTPVIANAPVAAPVASIDPNAASPNASSSSSGAAGHPATAEVEIFGKITVPAGAPKDGKLVVYVAQDDCMKSDAHTLGHIPAATTTGSFAIEVFPQWGTDVTICGALEDASGNALWYGKAKSTEPGGVFHAEHAGEVTFNNVVVPLAKGPAHKFPRETK